MKDTYLVVGAAGGVGLQLIKLMMDRGNSVIATVMNDAEAEIVRNNAPGAEQIIILDLSNADNIKPTLDPILDNSDIKLLGGAVCAGLGLYGPIETTPLADLRRSLEVNAIADLAVYQTCMPYLRKTCGRLMFIISNAGRIGIPFLGHYVASKFALEGLGDVMRREAANFGVKIILIEPGGMKTNMPEKQKQTIQTDIDALTPEVKEMYGEYYEAFKGMLMGIEVAMEPVEVAELMLEAFETPEPKTRYQIGQDSIATIKLAYSATDREIDEFFKNVFSDALNASKGNTKETKLWGSYD